MVTIVGDICHDVALLLQTSPYNLFCGFAILGIVLSLIIKWFKFKA